MTDDETFDDFEDMDLDEIRCPTCHGDHFVIIGLEVDCWDGVNGPYNNEAVPCPNCGGSGRAEDCTYW